MNKIDSFRNEYHFLSNFYNSKVTYNGIEYLNNESAFQAQKCVNSADKIKFKYLNPSDAKKLGRKVSLRNDWDMIKVLIMHDIVFAKFKQNPSLAEKLFQTGDVCLEEGNNWGDKFWGTVEGVGQNQLGKILMEVREELKG